MKRVFAAIAATFFLAGCQSKDEKWNDMRTVAEMASESAVKRIPYMFENNFWDEGVVVRVEEHPISRWSSAGIHFFTYHVECKVEVDDWTPPGEKKPDRPACKAYVLPVTVSGLKANFKVGDKIKLKGWIEKVEVKGGSAKAEGGN